MVVRGSAPSTRHAYGWWEIDSRGPTLINQATSERLGFRGKVGEPGSDNGGGWLRFEYEHTDLRYPVFVHTTRFETYYGTDDLQMFEVWRVDHDKSAEYWCQEQGKEFVAPSYGVWRRVDDCIRDAFACWPETSPAQRRLWLSVYIDGGWHNGRWTRQIHHLVNRISDEERRREEGLRRAGLPSGAEEFDSYVVPLDTPVPSPWRFYGLGSRIQTSVAAAVEEPAIPIENNHHPVYIKRKQWRPDDKHPREEWSVNFPAEHPLEPPDGHVPYLMTEDKKGLIYPYFGHTRHHSVGRFDGYVDSEIAGSLRAIPGSLESGTWKISIGMGTSCRRDGERQRLLYEAKVGAPPTRYVALRLHWAILDAWLEWKGTTARCSEWLPEISLHAADCVGFLSNYRGGVWRSGSSVAQRQPFTVGP